MLDTFGLPPSFRGDVQLYTRPVTANNTQWDVWRKPRGVSMCQMLVFGGGGGGGGGFSDVAGTPRGGGGSGGSAGFARAVIPIFLLPDILYIQVGAGGQGVGSGGGTAGSGQLSFISVYPANSGSNLVLGSGGAATGGGTGTGSAAGAAGAAGSTPAVQPFGGLGQFNALGGQAGVAGGVQTGSAGPSISLGTGVLLTGGAGGAGTQSADFAGGGFVALSTSYISEQRPATAAAGSFNGSGGPQLWTPFFSYGGCGGSASDAGIGGAGGNGARGAGGGGGGGGTTGGRGGDGGDGLVVIVCW